MFQIETYTVPIFNLFGTLILVYFQVRNMVSTEPRTGVIDFLLS